MNRLFFVFASSLILASVGRADSENQLFYDAVRAEAAKDFDSAIRFYEQSAKKSHSANLYGNLANLYFKKEMFGRSILNYRKALLLAPENRDFTANLAFVRETARIQGSSLDKQSSYFYFDVSPSSINAWTVFTAIIFWGGLGAMGLIFFWQFDRILQVILFLLDRA